MCFVHYSVSSRCNSVRASDIFTIVSTLNKPFFSYLSTTSYHKYGINHSTMCSVIHCLKLRFTFLYIFRNNKIMYLQHRFRLYHPTLIIHISWNDIILVCTETTVQKFTRHISMI